MNEKVMLGLELLDEAATITKDAVLGDHIAFAKILARFAGVKNISEVFFLKKLDRFFKGADLTVDERSELCAKLVKYGNKEESAMRIVNCIDKASNNRIVDYLVNATRCLVMDFITVEEYFRICNALVNTIEEDLKFLQKYVCEDMEYKYNIYTSGLSISGLVHQSNITWKGEIFYKFTFLAHLVDQFALSYGDAARYPNPKNREYINESLTTNIETNISLAAEEEIHKMF